MFRKISLSLTIFALLALALTVSADPALPGCYVDAPASINEGDSFTATVTCNDVTDNVFGFEFGTSFSSAQATAAATDYTPGNFVTGHSVIVGQNSRSTLYAVSRQGVDTSTGDFTLGSFGATSNKGLTADSSATISIVGGSFKLSDNFGAALTSWLQASPNITVTIVDTPLALLSGNVTVASDGTVGALANVDLTVGATSFNDLSAASAALLAINVGNLEYTAASDAALAVNVIADMGSHLACTLTSFALVDGANVAATKIGTITLDAGDVVTASDNEIDIDDATAMGAAFGTTTAAETDVNRDGVVNIFDLVHVGRNYTHVASACTV
jgi:hypothetical protein